MSSNLSLMPKSDMSFQFSCFWSLGVKWIDGVKISARFHLWKRKPSIWNERFNNSNTIQHYILNPVTEWALWLCQVQAQGSEIPMFRTWKIKEKYVRHEIYSYTWKFWNTWWNHTCCFPKRTNYDILNMMYSTATDFNTYIFCLFSKFNKIIDIKMFEHLFCRCLVWPYMASKMFLYLVLIFSCRTLLEIFIGCLVYGHSMAGTPVLLCKYCTNY